MAIVDVLKVFNALKKQGAIDEFMLFGSVAAMAYTRPFFTRDIDIAVAVKGGDRAFLGLFKQLAEFGKIQGHAVVIQDTPVEVFPANISPIIQDALEAPDVKQVEGITVNVAKPEHLLLEALRVHRSQDKARVLLLDEVVHQDTLRKLFKRLDHDGTLARRYQALTQKAP